MGLSRLDGDLERRVLPVLIPDPLDVSRQALVGPGSCCRFAQIGLQDSVHVVRRWGIVSARLVRYVLPATLYALQPVSGHATFSRPQGRGGILFRWCTESHAARHYGLQITR